MIKTSTFTVNDIGDMESVIASIDCRQITIGEDPSVVDWPTTDFLVKGSVPGSVAVRCSMGVKFTFEKMSSQGGFQAGEVVGYVATVSGSTTFLQVEQ